MPDIVIELARPDELPEAADFKPSFDVHAHGFDPEVDSGLPVVSMLVSMGQTWGDYSVRMRRGSGALGNAALQAAGTPEQKQRWA